ncbi:hypothetical protein E2C01_072271 [Portunus trituberculatus]|nr:hypothetical protein [Portunus trituberculatus]
MWKQRR